MGLCRPDRETDSQIQIGSFLSEAINEEGQAGMGRDEA
jgi:hypothetical protein